MVYYGKYEWVEGWYRCSGLWIYIFEGMFVVLVKKIVVLLVIVKIYKWVKLVIKIWIGFF